MPTHIVSAYYNEKPKGDEPLAFPWKPTTMLSLDPDINEAKEIVLDPPVKCLHKLTGDRRPKQPKGPCNLATDYYLVPQFESMEDRENQIICYCLSKERIRLVQRIGSTVYVEKVPPDEPNSVNKDSWSDDGVSADRGGKKKRFQWQKRIKPPLRAPGRPLKLARPIHLHVVLTGGIDPVFKPDVGDIVLVPPKRQIPDWRIPNGACIMTLRESDTNFQYKSGDLVMSLGRYVQPPPKQGRRRRRRCPNEPPILYDPFASVSLYQCTSDGRWRLMGCHQKEALDWVPYTHDYLYSAGKDLKIGTKCPYGAVRPKLGDIIIRQGAWDEDFDHQNNYRRSLVKWWTPRFQFRYGITQGVVLVRPFIDGIKRPWAPKEEPHFFWGRVEMFVYWGQHAKDGWKYWGSDENICYVPPYEPPANVFHYVEDSDVDTGGIESECRYRSELQEVWGNPGTFVDIQKSGYPL
ncbi:unnamed protein product [Calypogeia fissa]